MSVNENINYRRLRTIRQSRPSKPHVVIETKSLALSLQQCLCQTIVFLVTKNRRQVSKTPLDARNLQDTSSSRSGFLNWSRCLNLLTRLFDVCTGQAMCLSDAVGNREDCSLFFFCDFITFHMSSSCL